MRRDERVTDEMVELACKAITEKRGFVWPDEFSEDEKQTGRENIRAALSAALSIEQTQPAAHLVWRQYLRAADDVEDYYEVARPGDKCVDGSEPFPVYAHRPVSALVNAEADADVVERWQPIDTAPRDGTPVDLWGVNHLHPRKTGRRATDVTWGRVRDWLGNERDDWQHGQGDDFEPTHWCPVPAAPLYSLRPAEVGSATLSKGSDHVEN